MKQPSIMIPKVARKRRRNHVRRDKTRSRAKMIRELDAVARQIVFERDGFECVRCRSVSHLQWAHVFSRRHLCLRWESDNAMTLCVGCHLFWHHEPALAVDWYIKTFRDRYERIRAALQMGERKINVAALWLERVGEKQ